MSFIHGLDNCLECKLTNYKYIIMKNIYNCNCSCIHFLDKCNCKNSKVHLEAIIFLCKIGISINDVSKYNVMRCIILTLYVYEHKKLKYFNIKPHELISNIFKKFKESKLKLKEVMKLY
jgi:hypothetical protein